MKNNGFKKELLVKLEDKEMIDVSREFLNDVEKGYAHFNIEFQKHCADWEKYTDSDNYIFEPEKLSKKSPLTLINAPWGTGKTFFIENFMKLLFDKKIKSDVFEKFIIIDAWKFSNSKDVPYEFIAELTRKILKSHSNIVNDTISNWVVSKMLKKIAPSSVNWQINLGIVSFGANYSCDVSDKVNENEAETHWIKIENNKTPTLIFIDNIERLGGLSWDLLKAIIKLQEFPKFTIILPLNIERLKNNSVSNNNSEYPINKYIDFKYFDFKQDYANFFKVHFTDVNTLNSLNLIFNTEIDGEKLTIREVENAFKTSGLLSVKLPYFTLLRKVKEIWFPEKTFEEILTNDIESFLEHESNKLSIYFEVSKLFLEKDLENNFLNIPMGLSNDSVSIVSYTSQVRYHYVINKDYKNVFAESLLLIKDKLKQVKENIFDKQNEIKNQNVIKNNIQKISEFNNDIQMIEIEINNTNELINRLKDSEEQIVNNVKKVEECIKKWNEIADNELMSAKTSEEISKALIDDIPGFNKKFVDNNGNFRDFMNQSHLISIIEKLL